MLPRWGWGSVNKPMDTCLLDSAQSQHRPGQAEGGMKSGPRETTTRPAHGKMGPGGKVRRAIEAQGEERPLGPGWSGTASWRGRNFSWALGAEKHKENQGRKKEFQVGLTGEQNLIGRESAGIFSVAKNRNPLWLAQV